MVQKGPTYSIRVFILLFLFLLLLLVQGSQSKRRSKRRI
jgi:hypothetical protein